MMFDQILDVMQSLKDVTPYIREPMQIGPGRKTLRYWWKNVHRSNTYTSTVAVDMTPIDTRQQRRRKARLSAKEDRRKRKIAERRARIQARARARKAVS